MIGTGYIIEVKIDERLDVQSLEFYIERGGEHVFKDAADLVRIDTEEGTRKFALIDGMSRGHLMCCVNAVDHEPLWEGRPQVFRMYTGITIGACMCDDGRTTSCGGYEFGFKIVNDIPKDSSARIYVGAVKSYVTDYSYITEGMVKEYCSVLPVEPVETSLEVVAGDRVVVLAPRNENLIAKKGDGFGGKMPFDTGFMGANGDVILRIGHIDYKVYGEFMTVDGNIIISIE